MITICIVLNHLCYREIRFNFLFLDDPLLNKTVELLLRDSIHAKESVFENCSESQELCPLLVQIFLVVEPRLLQDQQSVPLVPDERCLLVAFVLDLVRELLFHLFAVLKPIKHQISVSKYVFGKLALFITYPSPLIGCLMSWIFINS